MKKVKTNLVDHSLSSEIAGWVGVILILIAYVCTSLSLPGGVGKWYQGMNALGAFLLVAHAYKRKDWELTILNLVWMVVAVIALAQLTF